MQYLQYLFLPNTVFIDIAATNHYVQDKAPLEQIKQVPNLDSNFLTNESIIKSTHTGILPNLSSILTSNKTA